MKFGPLLCLILLFCSDLFAADYTCSAKAVARDLHYLKQLINSPRSDSCRLPDVGVEKTVFIPNDESLTTVGHSYLIRRTVPKKIDIFLSLGFYSEEASGNREELDKLTEKWQGIASTCLKKTHGKIFTANGEEVQIKLQDTTLRSGMSISQIKIKSSGRANSANWTENMQGDCATIFHELLHLMGLVDEYEESERGIKVDKETHQHTHVEKGADKPSYDCRKYYEKNSIMARQRDVWDSAFSNNDVTVKPCECINPADCKSYEEYAQEVLKPENLYPAVVTEEFLEKKRNQRLPSQCPKGYRPAKKSKGTILKKINKEQFQASQLPFSIASGKITPNAYKFREKKSSQPLLEPRHLDAILFPGCMAKNQKYYENSANSYRTSQSNGGDGCMNLSWPLN